MRPSPSARTPQLALPGAKVMLSGTTPATQDGAKVNLSITITPAPTKDDAEPLARDAKVTPSGGWAVQFADTLPTGRYDVVATAPDGKGTATTHFDIVSEDAYDEWVQEVLRDMEKSLDATEAAALEHLEETIAGLPAGPAKNEIERQVEGIKRTIKTFPMPRPNPIPPPIIPGLPAADRDELLAPIVESARSVTADSERIREQIKMSRVPAETCQRLDTAVEALGFLSTVLNFHGSFLEKVGNHLTDKVSPALIDNGTYSNTDAKFSQAEMVKVAVARLRGMGELVKSVPGLGIDLIGYITKNAYGIYCTRFEGPFAGTLSIEFYTDATNRDMYWGYQIQIAGTMHLSQPKGFDKADGSVMIGRVDGIATGYSVYEDALKLKPGLRSTLVFHKLIPPPEKIRMPPVEMGALFNTLTHPLGFQAAVRGVRKGDEVIINLDETPLRDMSEKFNRSLLIQVFAAGLIPALNYQTLPMQGGHYILTRGMRKDAVFKLESIGKEQHLHRTFTRTEDTGDISLRWDIEVDMCNPACSKTSIQRLSAWWAEGVAKRKAAEN